MNTKLRYLSLVAILFCSCTLARAQTITTFIGTNAHIGISGDGGPASAASFGRSLYSFTLDRYGNFYLVDSNRIRKVDTNGIINYFAGTGNPAYSGDNGRATAAGMNPGALRTDEAGNIYMGDIGHHRIRKIDTFGIITTVAGGISGSSGNGGPATAAAIGQSTYMTLDAIGNIYIPDDAGHTVRKVDTNGIIVSIAGNGATGFSGDGGPATAATLGGNTLTAIASDTRGNVYFCDFFNFRIRKISASGIITTVAGNGTNNSLALDSVDGGPATTARVAEPAGMAVDKYGNIYYTEYLFNTVRMIDTNGNIHYIANKACTLGYSGDGGPATAATFFQPKSIWVDSLGTNIYIADERNRVIRRITYPVPPNHTAVENVAAPALAVTLSPNPAVGGRVTLLVNSNSGETGKVTITDVQGRLCKQLEAKCGTAKTFDIEGPPGVYVVHVVVGSKEWQGKLVVE